MKKRHIFYIVYFIVTFICIVTALTFNPLHGGTYNGVVYPVYGDISSNTGDVMLAISGILIIVGFLFFVGMQIRKIIIDKTCK